MGHERPCTYMHVIIHPSIPINNPTTQAAAKRFRVTGSGKVRARRSGKQHMNEKKSKDRKRRLSEVFVVNDSDLSHVKGQLPYARIRKTQNTITAKKNSK